MLETERYGFDRVRQEQIALGAKVRALFESRGIRSVAAEGFKAPGVVVSYTDDPGLQSSKKFSPKACKPRPACRCNAMKAAISPPSASVSSGWRNGTTLNLTVSHLPRPLIGWESRQHPQPPPARETAAAWGVSNSAAPRQRSGGARTGSAADSSRRR